MIKKLLCFLLALPIVAFGQLADDTKTKSGNFVDSARWSQYPATQAVDMAHNGITNAGNVDMDNATVRSNIVIGGVSRTNWPNTANEWSKFPATTNVDMAGHPIDNVSTAEVDALILGEASRIEFRAGALDGTNGIYFFNPANQTNYWILFP